MRNAITMLAAVVLLAGCKDPDTTFRVDHCETPLSAPGPLADAVARQLRVASINMWGITVVSQYIDERFAALAERLRADPSVDVVGLQEVWDGDSREQLLAALRDVFPHQIDFHGEHGRSGLALLSRRPFVGEPRFRAFDAVGAWWKPWNGEWFGGKGVGAVRVDAGDGSSIWVAVTHLHACYDAGAPLACDQSDEFASYRRRQVEQMRDFVNELAGEEPAVVLGDFNFTPTSDYFRELSAPRAGAGFDPGWLRVPEPHAPPTRIDHVWLRPGASESWQPIQPAAVSYAEPIAVEDGGAAVPLSDHCAIVATVGR
jgi:endonuclease/exonuclease/phosphatase family metal-dependent hydrolase